MSILRHVANVCLGAACLMGLGFSLDLDEVRVLLTSISGDEVPAPNLGDCLHNVDRSYWPRTYAAICKDIRAGIAAELTPVPAAATPLTRPATHEPPVLAPARSAPVARNSTAANVEPAAPRQNTEPHSCNIGETGMLTLRQGDAIRRRSAHFPGVTPTAQNTGGLALGVPPYCDLESPVAGQVLFAGEFKGYKSVLIIGLAGGHRLVIAGLGTLAVKRGEAIARGQILAASSADPAPALATAFGGEAASLIYFDMRNREGGAEPLPWLSAAS
ncbi:peptidoglycan DD-metalloendopeptidase family protein [Parvibaculum sedimenti]|nr:peptidoglycan DD-metalloendopeptidase family protein [Parvibaculum sedimenti]